MKWITDKVPVIWMEDSCGFVALNQFNDYMGALVLDTITENSTTCTFVIENPIVLKHKFLHLSCSYVFDVLGKKKAYVQVASNNERSLKFVKKIGFEEQCTLKDAFRDGVDCVILELTRDKCKYLLDEE